jgi:hypothetical protein
MAITIPSHIPKIITAGDTLKFTFTNSDYPASTWTGTCTIINSTDRYTFTATNDSDGFAFVVSSTSTGEWTAGDYSYVIKATASGETYTLESGSVTILADYLIASDKRSHYRKMLDAIRSVLEGGATDDVASYSIGGRSLSTIPRSELIKHEAYYSAKVVQEEKAEKNKRGESSSRNILVRFSNQ